MYRNETAERKLRRFCVKGRSMVKDRKRTNDASNVYWRNDKIFMNKISKTPKRQEMTRKN